MERCEDQHPSSSSSREEERRASSCSSGVFVVSSSSITLLVVQHQQNLKLLKKEHHEERTAHLRMLVLEVKSNCKIQCRPVAARDGSKKNDSSHIFDKQHASNNDNSATYQ
jgi:hypothetical protein